MAGATATKSTTKVGGQAAKGRTTKIVRATKTKTEAAPAPVTRIKSNGNGAGTVARIVKGAQVYWTQRTRSGETRYEGTVTSGKDASGRQTVKLTSNGTTMKPMAKWLQTAAPSA